MRKKSRSQSNVEKEEASLEMRTERAPDGSAWLLLAGAWHLDKSEKVETEEERHWNEAPRETVTPSCDPSSYFVCS